ncbi:MAG: DUF6339 family protein [Candidatus Paceibacterota bacterium]
MNQLIFTDDAYKSLVKSIADNFLRYSKRKQWLTDQKSHANHYVKSTIIPKRKPKFLLPSSESNYDFENAVEVHACYELTPVQASDPRLWARLAHVEGWDYMQRRWTVEDSKTPQYVRQRYFVAGADSRAIIRNGIARLWWSAEITKNPKSSNDPYKLTRVILSKLDITQQLLERSYGRSRKFVQATLRFIERNAEECLHDGQASRNRVRHLAKQLSLRSGVTILDSMPEANLHEFLAEELKRFNKSQKE